MYFVRFVNSREQALQDLERGYSFDCYNSFLSEEDAIEFYNDIDNNFDKDEIVKFNENFLRRLPGLCSFGSFNDIENAIDFGKKTMGRYSLENYPFFAIYEAIYIGDDWDTGVYCQPKKLIGLFS